MANASSYRKNLRGKRPSPGRFTSPPAQGCPRFIRYGALRGVSRVNTDTFLHGGCSPYRFSLLPPDRARPFHHRLAASRTGISRPICLNVFPGREPVRFSFCLPPARSPFRPGCTRRNVPGRLFAFSRNRPVFRQTPHSIFFGPDNGHPLVATKDRSPFFYPLHETACSVKGHFPLY